MKRLALIAAVVAAFACSAAGPAAAAKVVTAPDGTVTLVSGLQYMQIHPDGTHTPFMDYATRVSEEEGGPDAAVAPDGTVTVAWRRTTPLGTVILARRVSAAGEPVGTIAELGESEDPHVFPEVAVAPDGAATVVWTATHDGQTVVESSRIAPDGTAQTTPTPLATDTAYQSTLAVGPDGTATVGWLQFGSDKAIASARQIAPDGTLGDVLQLSSGVGSAEEPQIAATPSGAVVLAWTTRYSNGGGSDEVIEERRIAPDGSLDPQVNVISAEPDARAPVLAAGPDGTVTILWKQSSQGILERRIAPDGTPEAQIYDVSSPVKGTIYPEIAVAADGSATVVWTTGWQVYSRHLDATGAPVGAPQELLNSNGYTSLVGMGSLPDGSALPIWWNRLGYYEIEHVLQARRLPAAGGAAEPTFNLTEPGTEPATWASPASVDFGAVPVNGTATQTVTFTNRSVDATPVSGVFLQGPDAAQFEIVEDGCTGTSIPFVSTCSVTVAFDPKGVGSSQAELALSASAPREPRVVPLAGTAVPPGKDPPAALASPEVETPSLALVGVDKHGDSASLSLEVPQAGSLTVTATCPRVRGAKSRWRVLAKRVKAGLVKVPIAARGACRRDLELTGSLKLKVSARYQPQAGPASRAVRSLLLRRR